MITAKDIFIMEQEMIAETRYLMYKANLSPEEVESINNELPDMTEGEWDELQKRLNDLQTNPLQKVKNGELLLMKDVNIACHKASKNE